MKLFHKKEKREISDETLDRLLNEAYAARLAGLSANVCRDKYCLSAVPAEETPTVDPTPVRSTPARAAYWRTVAAAVLFLSLTGVGAWLLNRALRTNPEPYASAVPTETQVSPHHELPPGRRELQNCSCENLGGESVYVVSELFNCEYEGEYEIQSMDAWISENSFLKDQLLDRYAQREPGDTFSDLSELLPTELRTQKTLSYSEYVSYCEQWGLEKNYDDPEQNYLALAIAYLSTDSSEQPYLTDVIWSESGVRLCIWINDPNPYESYQTVYPSVRVLILPTANKAEWVQWYPAMAYEEYQERLAAYQRLRDELEPEARSSLKNCRPAELGDEISYVLIDPDAVYDGEYDLQRVNDQEDFYQVANDGLLEDWLPKGFAQKRIMTWAEYAAYCENWGLKRKYDDPEQNYLVYAWAYSEPSDQQPILADAAVSANMAFVFLWYYEADGIYRKTQPAAWVLTLPTSKETKYFETPTVLSEAEYEFQAPLYQTALTSSEDGSVQITGWTTYWSHMVSQGLELAFMVNYGGKELPVCVDENTELQWADGSTLTVSYLKAIEITEGEAVPKLYLIAEGCREIGLTVVRPKLYEEAYCAERIIVYSAEEAEQEFVFTKTESGSFLSPSGEEYVFLANEDLVEVLGELSFEGCVAGEAEFTASMRLARQNGFYSIKGDATKEILIRQTDSEWRSIYRKADLPPLDLSVDNCVRLRYENGISITENKAERIDYNSGITDRKEIVAFLDDVRAQQSPLEAGLYELCQRPDGFLENCTVCGVIYGYFDNEPYLAVPMQVTSYNDLAYSVSIGNEQYVLPAEWYEKLLKASGSD